MKIRAIQEKHEEFPVKDSPVALAFENEIKRLSVEKDLEMSKVIARLSELTTVGERQIYNYRSGKTDIPSMLIPVFCKQFGSNALAMAVVTMCNETEFDECEDSFDLARFASQTVRNVLQSGDEFLAAFDDARIDGHELSRLKLSSARIIRDATRLCEIAESNYQRCRAA